MRLRSDPLFTPAVLYAQLKCEKAVCMKLNEPGVLL